MSTAAIQARHHSLTRIERAAGEAFGCYEEAVAATGHRSGFVLAPAALALATVATALAATFTYLV